MTTTQDRDVLVAARSGDEQAFVQLTAPHRQLLHRHCYRMLGSLHDADDAVQETMLRAWRGIGGYQPQAPLRAWLARIATNVCLRMLERRQRSPKLTVDAHLEPYPDGLLETLTAPNGDPFERVAENEQIGLAFVAAMQLLPPKQRVAVLARDVLGMSANETADLLDDSVPAVNSALQRGRSRLEREARERKLGSPHEPTSSAVEQQVMRRFQEAWKALDFDGIVALLSNDALLTMPPEDVRFRGPAQIGTFFATAPLEGRLDQILLTPTRANHQPALAAYAEEDDTGTHTAYGIMVFSIRGDKIGAITGFPQRPDLFLRLGLPTSHGRRGLRSS